MDREVWEKHSNFFDECLMVLGGHDSDGTPIYIGRYLKFKIKLKFKIFY